VYPELSLGPLHVSTYYILTSLACVVASLWFLRRTEARGLARLTAIDLTLVTLVAGFFGARFLHVAFEEPDYYREHPWAVLLVWNGGFVYLGGLIAGFLAGLVFCQWRREPFWAWADAAALPAGLGYAVGRVGCFLNGCCYGHECRLPWAIHLHGADRHPTQLYATLWNLVVIVVLSRRESSFRRPGALFHAWLISFSVGRLVMEAFRDDPRGPALLGTSLGVWMSLVLISLTATNWLRQS